ncbi:MAG: glycoside-pentoside-hexuronide (GPH):cation symporter [Clostridiales bacterium]|nr:glycoside-pentoside-hexuronide (GPH):cation symporter [Clostridiales bacterium]
MKLGLKERFAYALGAVGKDMAYALASGYVLYYYQDVLGVDAWIMGIILLAARIIDALNAPIMGVVVAKTHTRYGRFRPWMLVGTLLSSLLLYLVYAAPGGLSGRSLAAYAAVIYIIWGATYTMMDIPFWSMLPAFTRVGREREGMTSLSRTAASLGAALINVLTVKAVRWMGGNVEVIGFRRFALLVSIVFAVTILITCLCIKEKPVPAGQTVGLKQMIRTLVTNDQTMCIVAICVLVNGAMFITSNMLIYFFKYDLAGATWYNDYTMYTGVGSAVQLLSMMFVLPMIRQKCTSERTFHIGIGLVSSAYLLTLLLLICGVRKVYPLFLPAAMQYTAYGLLSVMLTVSLANTVEYGRWRFGRSDESVIFSMQAFVIKLTSGIAAMIVSLALTAAHIKGEAAQGDAAVRAVGSSLWILRLTVALLPMLMMLGGMLLYRRKYILTDEKMETITKELKDVEI